MIQSLHSLTLSVPDLEVGKAFYTCMGLNSRLEGKNYVFQCDGRDQDQLRLIQGPKKEIAWMTWTTHQQGYAQILKTLKDTKIDFQHAHAGASVDDETAESLLHLHGSDLSARGSGLCLSM